MFTVITRILRAVHVIPPTKADPLRRPNPDGREAGTANRTTARNPTVPRAYRDDTGRKIEGIEPAMAGIPGDAVQRMPRVASPGLPPVDPVVATHLAKAPPRSDATNVTSPALAAPESTRTASPLPTGSGWDSGSEVQAPGTIYSCRDVAGSGAAYPYGDPSGPEARNGPSQGSLKDWRGQVEDRAEDATATISAGHADACVGTVVAAGKDETSDTESGEGGGNRGDEPGRVASADAPAPPIDSRGGDRLPRAGTPAGRSTRIPPRIADRPRVEEWADDELLTLPEAAALFWPAGPITTNTLRTAERDGTLTVTKVAGKFFTTPMAIRRMGVDEVGVMDKGLDRAEASPQALLQMKLAEAKRLGGNRSRARRGTKRPAVPSA